MNVSDTVTSTMEGSTPGAGQLGRGAHLTRAERAAVGGPPGSWCPWGARRVAAGAGSCRSGGPARGAGGKPGAGAGPDPVRPDAGVTVHVLSRRRLPDGRRPCGRPRTGLTVQLCGDAHLSNFGIFAAPDRRLVFSLNDFDETLPGPFEWDVKRLVASFAVAGRDRGFDETQRETTNLAVAASYREAMHELGRDAEAGRLVRPVGRRRARGRAEPPGQVGRAQEIPQEPRQGPRQGQHQGLRQAGRGRRRTPAADQRPAHDRQAPGAAGDRRVPRDPGRTAGHPAFLPTHAVRRSPAPAGGLPIRRRCPQGGRGRKRRHPRMDRVDGRQRRHRPAVPPGQGGTDLRPRALPGRECAFQPRPTGRRGTATHAVGQRHHAGLGAHHRPGRGGAGLLCPATVGRQRIGPHRGDEAGQPDRLRPAVWLDAGSGARTLR